MNYKFSVSFIVTFSIFLLTSCGGGGGSAGGGGTTTPTPTISISASANEVQLNTTITITWSSSNATSCSASGAWSGSKSTSGNEDITISTPGTNTFNLSCSGNGGSSSAAVVVEGYRLFSGVAVDGYIRGSEVFIDENDDFTNDGSEENTTTDNDGKFTDLKYANGNLISVGGSDLDTANFLDRFLILNKLSGHSDFIAITPVTSVAAFMDSPDNINSALGIDASIDTYTTDPVAKLEEGDIYKYLYEKGNQLTVMAFSLQNAINSYNSSTDNTADYFAGIAEELEAAYTTNAEVIDIESEEFINKVVDNITTAKASGIDSDRSTNIKSALKAVIPVIRVMSNTATTTAIQDFAFTTLQTDINAIATGTVSTTILNSYESDTLRYIATDQGIPPEDLGWVNTPPTITSSTSFSAAENQTAVGTVTASDADGDSLTYSLSGTDAASLSINSSTGVITFNSAPDYETKSTYSVTVNVSDGTNSTSQTLTITVTNVPENMNALIFRSLPSTLLVAENELLVYQIKASNIGGDAISYSLSGTDAAQFNLSSSGLISFKTARDYENLSNNRFNITVTISDGTLTESRNTIVMITNVQENLMDEGQLGYSTLE